MKKTTKITLGLGTLALILGISGAFANSASAYRGDPAIKGPNYTAERHSAMEKAFANNDFEAWKALMANRGRVTEIIDKDNFTKFAQAHDLANKGDIAGAKKIRQELGLNLRDGSGQGQRNGQGRGLNR